MADIETKDEKDIQRTLPSEKLQVVRITVVGTNIPIMNKTCNEISNLFIENNCRIKGPTYIPTKRLRITTRKTPCGEGSKTWDHYQMRIHKRYYDVLDTLANVGELMNHAMTTSRDVKVSVALPKKLMRPFKIRVKKSEKIALMAENV
ncbi:hypothetical protein A3Q56_03521 [Intoshia linei]|uniref:Small ribosomal subunit protein uS10 domain-containing protein n=1 Tax=Intoshia linei TaxID=1819745 RepID=A0A177B4U6_9BILA|nr:hypothetical protein A3Q56_03521 [Intoshia linei]